MRRKDREVTEKSEIIDILRRCNTIRIGIQGEQYPYVVPVSFGLEVIDENPVVYFHGAREGMKVDLLRKNPFVCVEGDIFIKVEKTEHGITTRYESFIGFGKCEFLVNNDEILHGLKTLIDHYGYYDYPLDRCMGLQFLLMGRIKFETITGKRNMTGTLTAKDRAVMNHA